MATELVSNITSVEGDILKGGVRIVLSNLTSPPATVAKLEDVIGTLRTDASTFMKLKTGFYDVGRTTPDGFTRTTGWDTTEGIETDQDDENIGGGDPTGYTETGVFTFLEMKEKNIRLAYNLPAPTTQAAVASTSVEQLYQDFTGLGTLPEQQLIVLQMHPETKILYAWAYPRAQLQSVGDHAISKTPSGIQTTFRFKKDLTTGRFYRFMRSAAAL